MNYKVLVSFAGAISAPRNAIIEINDEEFANDLLKAKYIVEHVVEDVVENVEQSIEEDSKEEKTEKRVKNRKKVDSNEAE